MASDSRESTLSVASLATLCTGCILSVCAYNRLAYRQYTRHVAIANRTDNYMTVLTYLLLFAVVVVHVVVYCMLVNSWVC